MTAATDARLNSLDRMLDDSKVGDNFATEMFAVVDALDSSRHSAASGDRPGNAGRRTPRIGAGLLDGKVDKAVVDLVAESATLRWAGGRTFAAALERQAVRAQLIAADTAWRAGGYRGSALPIRPVGGIQPRAAQHAGRPRDRPREAAGAGRGVVGEAVQPTQAMVLAKRAVAARERTFGAHDRGLRHVGRCTKESSSGDSTCHQTALVRPTERLRECSPQQDRPGGRDPGGHRS